MVLWPRTNHVRIISWWCWWLVKIQIMVRNAITHFVLPGDYRYSVWIVVVSKVALIRHHALHCTSITGFETRQDEGDGWFLVQGSTPRVGLQMDKKLVVVVCWFNFSPTPYFYDVLVDYSI
jgi:hypothetical protein